MLNCMTLWLFFGLSYVLVVGVSCFVQIQRHFIFRDTLSSDHSSELRAASKVSIGIVGSGAVGGYYGARLWESGLYDVRFFMRGEHYEKSKSTGLDVTSVNGDIFIPTSSKFSTTPIIWARSTG